MNTNNQELFFQQVRAGLWEDAESTNLRNQGEEEPVDWKEVYQLAEEQAVVGLVLAGLETSKVKPPQELLLQWIGEVQMLEQRNKEMNKFIAGMIEKLREADIYVLLVKGSGLAQCYERPLWRSCGDIDFFISIDEFEKAVKLFLRQNNATQVQNAQYTKSFGVVIEPWFIELHGTLRNGLSTRMDRAIDEVQRDLFYRGYVRSWQNGKTQVFMPDVNNDLFLVFVHFIRHFYQNEFVLRQTCDWCRLLWTYKGQIDVELLEKRLNNSGLMAEWKSFAAFAVDYLGMPVEAMPLYDSRFNGKGERILKRILKGEPYSKFRDTWALAKIFPWNTIKFAPAIFFNVNGMKIKERIFG